MTVYVGLAFLVVFSPFLFGKIRRNNKRAQKYTCIIILLMMLLVMGLRSEKLGMYDVEYVYIPTFRNIQNMSMFEIFERYPLYRGNLLQILTKLFTVFSKSEHLWIFATSIPCLACLTHLIMKYGKNRYTCAFSFFMFMGLRMYGANFYLIRHSLAMAMLIVAFEAILERNVKKFIVFSIIATLFHTTAIVFLIAYPISRIKISAKQLVLLFCGVELVSLYTTRALEYFFSFLGNDNYFYNYSTRSGFASNTYIPVTIFLFFIAYIICQNSSYIKGRNDGVYEEIRLKDRDLCTVTINMLGLAICFMVMSKTISEFQRIGFFFLVVSLVGFSNIVHFVKNGVARYVLYVGLFALFLLYMQNALAAEMLIPYKTFFS